MSGELGRVLQEATGALSRLDAARLEELESRALALRERLADGWSIDGSSSTPGSTMKLPEGGAPGSAAELTASFRVFACVVKATGMNLEILERAGGQAAKRAGVRWVL